MSLEVSMTEKNPAEAQTIENKPKEASSIRAHEEETSVMGSAEFFNAALSEELEGCVSIEEAHQKTKDMIKMAENDLGEKAKGLAQSVESIQIDEVSSVEDYITLVSPILEQAINDRFSLKELEEIERNDILNHELNTGVNEIVYYQLDQEKKYITVNIHHAKSVPFKMIAEGFVDGLRRIAKQLKTNPDLSSVEEITARSWIIEKHPKIAERYGFTLNGIDSASISREDFIKRYGG